MWGCAARCGLRGRGTASKLQTMRAPRKPNRMPSLLPFVVMALVLLAIYGGLLLFPALKGLVNRQDCIATGRTDC